MSYTANKTSKHIYNGRAHVVVRYLSDSGAEVLEKTHSTDRVYSGWPDDVINAEIVRLNALDVSGVALGPPEAPKTPDPPTQDELDLKAFFEAMQEVIRIDRELTAAANSKVPTKLTQQDLADAYGVWKSALSVNPDKFLQLVPKDFPVL